MAVERRGAYRLIEVLNLDEQVLVAKATLEGENAEEVLLKALHPDTPAAWTKSMELLMPTRSPHLRVPLKVEKDKHGSFLITRWLEGPSLEQARVERFQGRVPVRQALIWLRQILLGLEVLHHHGLLHGDVKPSNVLLDSDDRAVLVDLDAVQPIGQNDIIAATDEYLTPVEADRSTVKRDLFAAAFTFGALITGTVPEPSPESQVWVPSDSDPLLPKAVDKILLGVQSNEGFQDIRDMQEVVDALLGPENNAGNTRPTSPPTRRVAVPKRSRPLGVLLWLLVLLCFPAGYAAAFWWKAPPVGAPYTLAELTGIDVREGLHHGEKIWQTTVLGRPVAAFAGPDEAAGGETAELRAKWAAAVLQQALLKSYQVEFEFRRELPQFSEIWLKHSDGEILLMRVTQREKELFKAQSPELARRWSQLCKDTLTLMGQKVAPGRSQGALLLRPWKTRAETLAGGQNLDRAAQVQVLKDAFQSLKPDLQEDILSAYLPDEESKEEKKKDTE